jgi:hypothetical protein
MPKTTTTKTVPRRTTQLALRGIDSASDDGVVLRFAAGGDQFAWRFKAATFDELIALALGGRLGAGKDVHFDAAKVSFTEGEMGRPGSVRIAIGRKVRIVAPAPARKAAAKRRRGEARSA